MATTISGNQQLPSIALWRAYVHLPILLESRQRHRMSSLRLDDRDPSILFTGGSWQYGGVSQEYNSTTTYIYGAGAMVNLQFYGASVAVWGTLGPDTDGPNPHTSYVVDGGTPFVFGAILDAGKHYNQIFFLSEPLALTSHTLTIETLTPGAVFFLDYIDVGIPSAYQSSATVPMSSITTTTLSDGIPTTSSMPTDTQNESHPNRPVPMTAVVGGSLGGFVLVICILFIWQLRILRRRASKIESLKMTIAVSSDNERIRYLTTRESSSSVVSQCACHLDGDLPPDYFP